MRGVFALLILSYVGCSLVLRQNAVVKEPSIDTLFNKKYEYSYSETSDSIFVADKYYLMSRELPSKFVLEKCDDSKELNKKTFSIKNLYQQRIDNLFHNVKCDISFGESHYTAFPICKGYESNSDTELTNIEVQNQYEITQNMPQVQGHYVIKQIKVDTLILIPKYFHFDKEVRYYYIHKS